MVGLGGSSDAAPARRVNFGELSGGLKIVLRGVARDERTWELAALGYPAQQLRGSNGLLKEPTKPLVFVVALVQ